MTLTEFLLARIAEDEALLVGADMDGPSVFTHVQGTVVGMTPKRFLAECEAKRRIVEWHQNWPVLTNTKPVFDDDIDLGSMTIRMSQQMAWLTEQEYRERFGDEPPTGPILRIMAAVYADHSDYQEAWRVS
jgi:hypothetical protein